MSRQLAVHLGGHLRDAGLLFGQSAESVGVAFAGALKRPCSAKYTRLEAGEQLQLRRGRKQTGFARLPLLVLLVLILRRVGLRLILLDGLENILDCRDDIFLRSLRPWADL